MLLCGTSGSGKDPNLKVTATGPMANASAIIEAQVNLAVEERTRKANETSGGNAEAVCPATIASLHENTGE